MGATGSAGAVIEDGESGVATCAAGGGGGMLAEDVGSCLKRCEGAGPFCGAAGGDGGKDASRSSKSDDSLSSAITAKPADGTNGVAVARKR